MNQASKTAAGKAQAPLVSPFFDEATNTFSYLVVDPDSRQCAVIDSVMNFDQASGTVSFTGADRIIAAIKQQQLELAWILETHVHADHLSAAPYLKQHLGGQVAISKYITTVQQTFAGIFNEGPGFACDGSQFDRLLEDEDVLAIGNMRLAALHTPGHTPACMSFVAGDAVFVGDTLFMPDSGSARVDFPGGDARTLFQSIRRLLSLPEDYRLFMCHDYSPNGRGLEYESSVAAERQDNIHANDRISEDQFVALREARDATLGMPQLILPSLQVNMRGGHLPDPEDNGLAYLKLPINAFA
jgi:glyoxylase-like metal-dependent hydrolase (beta-lactamase superfamily II)